MTLSITDVRVRISAEIGPTFASDLLAHLARGAVFLVEPQLELLEVAVAVATDDVACVERWITLRQLQRPSAAQLQRWSDEPEAPFTSVVVQPFVLAQERLEAPAPSEKH